MKKTTDKVNEYKFEKEPVFEKQDTPLSIFGLTNQEQYQKGKSEQTTYTFSGKIQRSVTIAGVPVDFSNNARVFFIARYPLSITKVIINYTKNDGANLLQVEKLVDTEVPGTGTGILKSAYDISLPGNISYIKEEDDMVMTPADRSLEKGDRLAIDFSSTPTTIENLTVLVEYTY